jgi:outer membrane murein-binding lipoprotein Lpp
MSELRPTTLKEIGRILDHSYFTESSFSVSNTPQSSPFLTITFLPKPEFRYAVYGTSDTSFETDEAPGEHLASGEMVSRKSFPSVLDGVRAWVRRIHDDIKSSKSQADALEEYMEQLRSQIFTDTGADDGDEFSLVEIQELRDKLDDLRRYVEEQAEKIQASEYQIKQFEQEIANIKDDLSTMPKGVWKKIAGNKLLKSIKGFLNTSEGRQLITDGLKKLIGM